jgi:hypothetical protein
MSETIAWIVLFVSVLYLADRLTIWSVSRALDRVRRRRARPRGGER